MKLAQSAIQERSNECETFLGFQLEVKVPTKRVFYLRSTVVRLFGGTAWPRARPRQSSLLLSRNRALTALLTKLCRERALMGLKGPFW